MNKRKTIHCFRVLVTTLWGALLFGGVLWLVAYTFQFGIEAGINEVKNFILASNQWKPAIFLLVFALRGFFLVPPLLLVILSGAIFEPVDAFLLSLAGQMISGILLYVTAQFVGREFIAAHENDFFKKIDNALSQKGFFATLVLTLIPFIPADTVTIVAAITGISFIDFLFGFLLGSVGIFVPFVLLGQSLTNSQSFIWTIIPFLFLSIIMIWAWTHPNFSGLIDNRRKKKAEKKEKMQSNSLKK